MNDEGLFFVGILDAALLKQGKEVTFDGSCLQFPSLRCHAVLPLHASCTRIVAQSFSHEC